MSAIIRELKRRIKELENRHRSLPYSVIETELKKRPISKTSTAHNPYDYVGIVRGSFIKGEVMEDDFVLSNLPRISFDSSTFLKIEEIAYDRLDIEEIRDAPRIPQYDRKSSNEGLELLRGGDVVASLYESMFYVTRDYEHAETLADALINEIYKLDSKPGYLRILLVRLAMALKKFFKKLS